MMNGFVMRTEMIFWHMELLFVRRNARELSKIYKE